MEHLATPKIWSVSEVNQLVKDILEQSLYPLWIKGEVSNLTIHGSGHVYFSIKDSRGQINCVFFRGADKARQLQLQNGIEVELHGRLTVYPARGVYQVLVQNIRTAGLGALQQKFTELKQKLRQEGLFDEDRKRPIPKMPKCVAVITAAQGAALQDFLRIINRRHAGQHIRIYPATVQGERAAFQISRGIEFFNYNHACDVIVITRGGGSIEDLWPFNEEMLARSIVASEIPIISAVGHEVDFTIADFVADLRVATPSAAAELVVAEKSQLSATLQNLQQRMISAIQLQLSKLKLRCQRATQSHLLNQPKQLVQLYQQQLDEYQARLKTSLNNQLQHHKTHLENLKQKLEILDPKQVLQRGYSILKSPTTNRIITNTNQLNKNQKIEAILAEGKLTLEIININ